ncbi:TPR-like protein [Lentithecium fluviatile CBS 122367]|uniref:TPR-like protein n=1 Tax=Lentithecium fluviatile CBS 122367 TaxID=1168545 RepID=A0A6G1J376_9PLEO|nr:TPR-like protein [Lentithecium fluviatile CBS 122367]
MNHYDGKKELLVCYFEAVRMTVLGFSITVVSKYSARIEGVDCFGFETDHKSLQRFESADNPDYRKLVAQLKRLTERPSPVVIPTRSLAEVSTLDRSPHAQIAQNFCFYGREDILEKVHNYLQPANNAERLKICTIHGTGGSGKTSIATQYLYQYGKHYKYTAWIRSEEPNGMARDFEAIAVKFNQTYELHKNIQRNIDVAKAQLCSSKEPWLLVFDNVVRRENLKQYIPPGTSGSILITTQSTDVKDLSPNRVLVEPFDKTHGAQVLLNYLDKEERDRSGIRDDPKDAEKISDLVKGLPLTIAVIAGYISKTRSTLPMFLSQFDESPQKFKKWGFEKGACAAGYDKLATVFEIALREIKPSCRDVLNSLSFMSPDSIPRDMLWNEGKSILSGTDDVDEIRKDIFGWHLIEMVGSVLSMHRLLRYHLRVNLEEYPERCQHIFKMAFDFLRQVVPRQSPTSSPRNRDWGVHALYSSHVLSLHNAYTEAIHSMPEILGSDILPFVDLLSDVANYMYERSLPRDALTLLRTAEGICDKVLGDQSTNASRIQVLYLRASIELNHGSTYRADAIARKENILRLRILHNRDVVSVRTNRQGGLHCKSAMTLSTAYNNLACAYMHASDYEAAAPLFRKSLQVKMKLRKNFNEPQIPGIAEVYKNQALVALSRGDFDEAIKKAEKASTMIDSWDGGGPDTKVGQFFRYMHACVLFNSGRVADSLNRNIAILEKRKDVLSDAHDHTIDSYFAVGMMYWKLGDYIQARANLETCLGLRHGYFETRLPRVLCVLSRVLRLLGEEQEADEKAQEARSLFEKLVPKDCPGIGREDPDELVRYDQMVNIWSGRFTGILNSKWQKEHHRDRDATPASVVNRP